MKILRSNDNIFLVSSKLEKGGFDSIGGNFEQLMLVEFGAVRCAY